MGTEDMLIQRRQKQASKESQFSPKASPLRKTPPQQPKTQRGVDSALVQATSNALTVAGMLQCEEKRSAMGLPPPLVKQPTEEFLRKRRGGQVTDSAMEPAG